MNSLRPLRHVVIGVGAGVFGMHRPALMKDTVDLVAVSDINEQLAHQRAEELGCASYTDHRAMLRETGPDVAVILTPHPSHAAIAIDCLEAGCHVLVEKPMAVHVAEADAMIRAALNTRRLLAVNFQQRFRPEVRLARKLIQGGQLGVIQHLELRETCTRTATYYSMSTWRGTWIGEGGGVLLNQAPHDLDLVCYLLGMPARVMAWTRNLLHQIETEDTAQAVLEWPHGALGAVHVSTAEAGGPQRLEILGTKGSLQLGPNGLALQQFDSDLREFVANSPNPYAAPPRREMPVELEPGAGDHLAVYHDLHAAILTGAPLTVDGASARMSLELANAMVYSSYQHQEVELPLDPQAYLALFEDLKAHHRSRTPG